MGDAEGIVAADGNQSPEAVAVVVLLDLCRAVLGLEGVRPRGPQHRPPDVEDPRDVLQSEELAPILQQTQPAVVEADRLDPLFISPPDDRANRRVDPR